MPDEGTFTYSARPKGRCELFEEKRGNLRWWHSGLGVRFIASALRDDKWGVSSSLALFAMTNGECHPRGSLLPKVLF